MPDKKINILIIGAGRVGTALIELFSSSSKVEILGVVDTNLQASGIKLAVNLRIPVSADYNDFINDPRLDQIINVSGDEKLQEKLQAVKPKRVELLAGYITKLIRSIVESHTQAEKYLKYAHAEINQIFNTAVDGMRVIDKNFKIVRINDTFSQLTGVSKEDSIGKSCREVFSSSRCGTKECSLARVLAGEEHFEYESERKRKSGEIIHCLVSSTAFRGPDGELLGAVEIFKDISEIKKAQDDLRVYSSQLERSNKELDDFTYIVSHDLKEPLRSIDAFSRFLQEDYVKVFDQQAQHYLERIRANAARMQHLIDDLLEISRIVRKKNPLQDVDVNEIILEVRQRLEYAIRAKNAEIIVVGSLPQLYCDKVRITEVFANLISNAIKFGDKQKTIIEIGVDKDGDYYRFRVRDNGPGIEEKYYTKIFEIFQRLVKREDYEGVGAGLTIAKKIVEKHKGKIWVESKIGFGSTFYFTIPAKKEILEARKKLGEILIEKNLVTQDDIDNALEEQTGE